MCKLSVVVPVYNTEKYLKRCIESLINQTIKDIEFIFVNDRSPGNAEEIIREYQKNDNRIKYVTYQSNRGLFRARMAGAEKARGEYIAFMDSDDFATLDYYRTLVVCAEEKNAEIVVGKTIFRRMDDSCYVRNLHDECFMFDRLEGDEVKKAYFTQKGLCFSWHTVWNKIYKKELWDKCAPFYKRIDTHLIMTEDIAFSSLLFYNAASVASVENEGYFYCENEEASTNAHRTTLKRFSKNMADIKRVFEFVEEYLDEVNAEEYIKDSFLETKKYYARMWQELADSVFSGEELKAANGIMSEFIPDFHEHTNRDDHFFESISTAWNGGLESIKEEIINSGCKYVSFDIFDTLIKRYVYRPDDVFLLMNKKFEELYSANISFDKLRISAERECRRRFGQTHPNYQDVTIDEIYECFGDYYGIPKDVALAMEAEEKRIEVQLSYRRRAAKEIFDAVIAAGKSVIIVSDMYLDRATVEAMLEKAGYKGYEKLYLSSEMRLTKACGDLFKAVIKDMGISQKDMIHIGDTWVNDVERPKSLGIRTIFFPKTTEVFENKIKGMNTNLCHCIGSSVCGAMCDSSAFMEGLGYRSMLAMAAGFYFDNPYRSFNEASDMNADPYFIGYYALGMHMLGLTKWIRENSKGYDNIYFLARDGYMPMLAYNMLKKDGDPKAQYIYASRRMLLPAMIKCREDLYDLPVEYRNHTPATILSMLDFCSDIKGDIPFSKNETFADEGSWHSFINWFTENAYDENKHMDAVERCRKYYGNVAEGRNIAFDMGYSGRIQTAVSDVCGKGIDVLFVHRDAKRSADMQRKGKYTIKCFYDFVPYMSGLIREHILSDSSNSCIGLDSSGSPIYDDVVKIYQDTFVATMMQRGALDLVKQFGKVFGEYEEYMSIKPFEVSTVFEGYLRCAKDIDRQIFKASYFEDMVYGSKDNINIYEFVKSYIMTLPVNEGARNAITKRDMLEEVVSGHSRFTRAIAYIVFDPQLFKLYIIDILNRRPKVLRILVRIKHTLFGVPGGKKQ